MSTTPRPSTSAEERYRQKSDSYVELITAKLQVLKAKRPDIYSNQIERLGGCHSDVEPCNLLEPDKLMVAAGALAILLEGYDVPSTAPGIPNDVYELPQTSHSVRSSQPPNQSDLLFVRDLQTNLGPQTSRSADSSQHAAQSDDLFAQGQHPKSNDSERSTEPPI